jgi:hypothetical protein
MRMRATVSLCEAPTRAACCGSGPHTGCPPRSPACDGCGSASALRRAGRRSVSPAQAVSPGYPPSFGSRGQEEEKAPPHSTACPKNHFIISRARAGAYPPSLSSRIHISTSPEKFRNAAGAAGGRSHPTSCSEVKPVGRIAGQVMRIPRPSRTRPKTQRAIRWVHGREKMATARRRTMGAAWRARGL